SVHSHFADFLGVAYGGRDPDGFLPKHRYIRVGGGYRHSFWYIKVLLEEIELARHQALIRQKRLETIAEGNIRAVKTYIRTKSGRMVEKVIFMSEDDYQNFQQFVQQGGDPSSLVRKYLSKEDAQNLQGFDKEEQKAIKTVVRTKSGRVIEKIVYVSRDEYDKIQRGEVDANAVLRRRLNLKDGEQLEKWSAPKMRTITTRIRTKSGRIIEKKVLVSDEDYQKLKEGKADLSKVLGKYLSKDDGEVEGWSAPQKEAMKVIKTYVRTKSGKLVEKTILMTEDEFKEFEKSGGDPNILKRFMKLKDGEKIDKWEKASTVYADSDDDGGGPPKKPGERTVDKHGNVFEYVKDPLTGKVYKKPKAEKIITAADVKRRQDLKQGKRNVDSESEYSYKSEVSDGGTRHVYRRVKKADGTYGDRESYHSSEDEEGQARRRRRRRERKHGNDSAKSFFSDVSEGGTRRVFVRERKPDGTYGEAKEYHSDDSDDFQQAAKAIKQQQKKAKERQHGSDSEHSYVSEYSENGTRTRKRRQRIRDEFGNVIGYGKEVEYESPQASDSDEGGGGGGGQGRKGGGKKGKQAGKGQKGPDGQDVVGGSDSEHSYVSEVSEHGTRHIMRRERIRDADGNVIGYGKKEEYTGKRPVLGHGADGKKSRKKRDETGVEYEVYSDTSEGGTKRTMRRKVIRDELGNVIGHGEEEVYDSDDADTLCSASAWIRIGNTQLTFPSPTTFSVASWTISFLDYLCYIPLFLSFHDNILSNPLDMSDLKYTPTYRRRASAQRDMNPLAFPLKKNTKFMRDHAVGTLMEGKPLDSVVRKDNEKVQKAFDRKEGLDNQRGIALECTTPKLLNAILRNRLLPGLNPLLLSLQSGFRPGRSTTEQVATIRCVIDQQTGRRILGKHAVKINKLLKANEKLKPIRAPSAKSSKLRYDLMPRFSIQADFSSTDSQKLAIRHKMSSLLHLAVLCAFDCVNGDRTAQHRVVNNDCLNLSLSVWQMPRPSASLLNCFMSSRSFRLGSVGVVQRNKRNASCALFRFGEVCRLLNLTSINSSTTTERVAAESTCDTVVDSEYDAIAANEHFSAVWVGDRGLALENLVCGSEGQRNPRKSLNVTWTSEGARMDGVSSRLWVDDPTGLDFTETYTWVLHLKRTPGEVVFLELSSCIGSGNMLDHLQEYSSMVGVSHALYLNPGFFARFQTGSVLPADPNEFFIAGVSFRRQQNLTRFFYGAKFLPTAGVFDQTKSFNQAGACIHVGFRYNNKYMLQGVVRAVAVSNTNLPEEAINKVFFGYLTPVSARLNFRSPIVRQPFCFLQEVLHRIQQTGDQLNLSSRNKLISPLSALFIAAVVFLHLEFCASCRNQFGMALMKSVARAFVWGPGIDADIELVVAAAKTANPLSCIRCWLPLHPWTSPGDRIHVDFAGPVRRRLQFLLLVEATQIGRAGPQAASVVCTMGPRIQNSYRTTVQHSSTRGLAIPYHAKTHGLVERLMKSFKMAMEAPQSSQPDLNIRLCSWLLGYRASPHPTTGRTPAELFLKRQLRTRMDLLRPSAQDRVLREKSAQKRQHDRRARELPEEPWSEAWARDYRPNAAAWQPAKVLEQTSASCWIGSASAANLARRSRVRGSDSSYNIRKHREQAFKSKQTQHNLELLIHLFPPAQHQCCIVHSSQAGISQHRIGHVNQMKSLSIWVFIWVILETCSFPCGSDTGLIGLR
uniref:Reverse transcriptase domain-containing protein n=1 Tax=Macrostomum lignano TaxID=282301 RepID=A0A1I8I866_9PLAT